MNEVLRAKFEAARRSPLPVGPHTFTIRRPSPWDVATAQASGQKLNLDWAAGFVVGWDLKAADLIPGGDPEPVDFDPEIFRAWIKDYPDYWSPLSKGVYAAYKQHEEALAARGNV